MNVIDQRNWCILFWDFINVQVRKGWYISNVKKNPHEHRVLTGFQIICELMR